MKHSLKNEYKNLINEERVSIETSKGFYDYEFDDINNINFKNLKFKDGDDDISNTEFRKEIVKSGEYSTYKDPQQGKRGFGLSQHSTPEISFIMQFVILRAIKNIVLFEKNAYKVACDSFMSKQNTDDATAITLASIIKFLLKKYNNTQSDYYKLLSDTAKKQYEKDNKNDQNKLNNAIELNKYVNTIIKNVIDYFENIFLNKAKDRRREYESIDDYNARRKTIEGESQEDYNQRYVDEIKNNVFVSSVLSGNRSTVKKAINMYFKRDFSDSERHSTANFQHTIIAYDYMADAPNALSLFYRGFSKLRERIGTLPLRAGEESIKDDRQISIRSYVADLSQIKQILDTANTIEEFKQINKMPAKNRKGKGEFLCHMLFNTSNPSLTIEPDVVIDNIGRFSVKSMATASARTGESLEPEVHTKMINFFTLLSLDVTNPMAISLNDVENLVAQFNSINKNLPAQQKNDIKNAYEELKLAVITEHDAAGIFLHKADGTIELKMKQSNDAHGKIEMENVYLSGFKNNRWTFTISDKTDKDISYEKALRSLFEHRNNNYKNKVLKEVYSHLFKKKLISEGGKAGHMMHPYENLHMKISEMKQMIRDFQNDFEISEKVDGANLFFTVNPDSGEVLFSRNRADMSHQETLEKFGPDHPAHILFTEGANSIFNSVKASLNTEDIKRIFGNSPEGGKTYVNFEIMHPQKPNQIKYDKKYIVFHAIVDFDINGNKVSSSPDDQRLLVLLEKLENYFENNSDFSLGSNLKIKLNTLTEQEVEELIQELDRISSNLGLSDDMTIADAVKKEINILLDREGLNELLSEDRIEMIYDFITNENTTVKGTQIKKGLDKEIQKSLTSLGVTSKAKTYNIIKAVIEDFKPLFILLGIKLLHTIPSRYMSEEASNKNVDELRRLLNAAIQDFESIKSLSNITDEQQRIIDSLEPNIENVLRYGIERVVSSPVEGGVFIGHDGNTYKVTGGFAPLNQILGTSMRSLDLMTTFKEEFIAQER